jgi:hypothetical protein
VTAARAWAAAALVAALPGAGHAHQAGLSHGTYALQGDRLEVTLRVASRELAAVWPELALPIEPARGGVPGALAAALAGTVEAAQDSGRCALEATSGHADPPDGARLALAFRCPGPGQPVRLALGFVARMPPGHVHLARTGTDGAAQVVNARDVALTVAARSAWWSPAGRYVVLGVEHILGGWDHLAFLVGLVLAGGGLGALVRTVTSFTVGHAVTLALAATGALSAPPSVVEPLIAASVVYVAVENLRSVRDGRFGLGRRWPIALAFGLVHGFGFAGALAEVGLPRAGLFVALASFNLGVELGQAAVVAAAFPLIALALRSPVLGRGLVPGASAAVGCAGLVWLVERLAG